MPSDVQNGHLALVRTRHRLVALDALELALVRTLMVEGASVNDLDSAEASYDVPREPHFAVAAVANQTKQFVIGNAGRRVRHGFSRWHTLLSWPVVVHHMNADMKSELRETAD